MVKKVPHFLLAVLLFTSFLTNGQPANLTDSLEIGRWYYGKMNSLPEEKEDSIYYYAFKSLGYLQSQKKANPDSLFRLFRHGYYNAKEAFDKEGEKYFINEILKIEKDVNEDNWLWLGDVLAVYYSEHNQEPKSDSIRVVLFEYVIEHPELGPYELIFNAFEYSIIAIGNDNPLLYKKLKEFINSGYIDEQEMDIDSQQDYWTIKAISSFGEGDLASSYNYLDSALSVANKILIKDTTIYNLNAVRSNYALRSEIFYKSGDIDRFKESEENLLVVIESIINQSAQDLKTEHMIQYETEKAEHDLALAQLSLKSETQQKEINKQRFVISLVAGVLIIVLGSFLFIQSRQKRKLAQQGLVIANQQMQDLIKDQEIKSYASMLKGQEEERGRIAKDLHDRLGGMLSAIKLQFSGVKKDENASKTIHMLDEASQEVRRISHNLANNMLEKFGLVKALKELEKTLNNSGKIQFELDAFNFDKRVSPDVERELYSILNELVSNTLKHANAKSINLSFTKDDSHITIMYEDDGKGFDVDMAMKKEGMGLVNIPKRVEQLKGKTTFDSQIGRGTVVIIELPA